ncbi:MAG: hypothetical protein ACE5EB_01425 [Thermodesulfobacteriota bacterium]
MITANIYQIVALVIALAFLILIIFAIPTLLQLKRTVKSFEELSTESKKSLGMLNNLLAKTGEHTGEVEEIFERVKHLGLKIINTAEFFVENIKSPLVTILSLVLGVQFGLKHFLRKEEKEEDEKDGGEKDVDGKE